MTTQFFNRYYPTVCIRRAEMKAMEQLPDSEKQKMLPIVLLAPWLNSIEFENTFKIVEKSIGKGWIIVDIDRQFSSSSSLPSRQYFNDLKEPNDGPTKWMELIKSHENYIPCIQICGVDRDKIYYQLDIAKKLGRGVVFRIELPKKIDIQYIFELVSGNPEEDFLIVFDYGYRDHSIELEIELAALIDEVVSISPQLRFVITGSSFPNTFSEFDDFASSKLISERRVYENLSRKYGNYNMYYGDWSSTKPRRYDGGGSKPLPRIDFPTSTGWIIARSKENEWTFRDAAERIVRLPEWQNRPMVWGTGLIEKTAQGLPGAISTGPQAIASRVNIHLYTQNNFGKPAEKNGPQGKWVDPI